MIYLDSSAFLNAFLDTGKKGTAAKTLLDKVQRGEPAATSALTYDEVFWAVKKHRRFEDALHASRALLEMPNLSIIAVDAGVLWLANSLSEKYKIGPRDAIHASCAITNGIRTMVSDDRDFDAVKEIERRGLPSRTPP